MDTDKKCTSCTCCERKKHTPRTDEELKALTSRLNRIIGQLNGIKTMLDENRYCGDILIQLSAAESALRNFGYEILGDHLKTCVAENILEGNYGILDETVELVKKLK